MLTRWTSAAALATALLLLNGGSAAAHSAPGHSFAAGHSGVVVDLLTAFAVLGCAIFAYWRWRRHAL
jgi:hypothetical protein